MVFSTYAVLHFPHSFTFPFFFREETKAFKMLFVFFLIPITNYSSRKNLSVLWKNKIEYLFPSIKQKNSTITKKS